MSRQMLSASIRSGRHRLKRFYYRKLLLFALSVVLTYFAFSAYDLSSVFSHIPPTLAFTSAFVFGLLYSFGFTSPFAAAAFVSMEPQVNIFRLAVAGGMGSMLADYVIARFVRFSFQDEIDRIRFSAPMRFISTQFDHRVPSRVRQALLVASAAVIIASPLPDEIGVSMLAGFTSIRLTQLAVISLVLNTLGILVLLSL